MAHFLCHGNYTPAAVKALLDKPQDREAAVRPLFEAAGGTVVSFYLGLGQSDWYVVSDLPDTVTAAAITMAVAASPSLQDVKTVPLLTPREAVEAMTKASGLTYAAVTG
jgi:uncharacterized protein with GYD domain